MNDGGCCCREAAEDMARQQMHLRQMLTHDLRLLTPLLPVEGPFAEQVEALRGACEESAARCEEIGGRMGAEASALCALGGDLRAETRALQDRLGVAEQTLRALRGLGRRLGEEAAAERSRRERGARERLLQSKWASSRSGCRAWAPVRADAFLVARPGITHPGLIQRAPEIQALSWASGSTQCSAPRLGILPVSGHTFSSPRGPNRSKLFADTGVQHR